MKAELIINRLNELYPEYLKASYDNVGLMVGDVKKDVKKILLALDLTRDVMDEAIINKCDMIITHHPLLFKPLSRIDVNKDPGSIISDLIKHDIINYAMHTNFDSVKMNEYLGNLIGLKDMSVLSLKENIGVLGKIDKQTIEDYSKVVLNKLDIKSLKLYGNKDQLIENVAIVGGSGSSFFDDCIKQNIDLFITGDVSYSRGLEAKRLGLNVFDVEHFVEHLYTNVVLKDINELDKDIEVLVSNRPYIPYIVLED